VLLIEDNLETRFIHQAALKSTGLGLMFARTLEEARALIRIHPPTVVVLDRMLDTEDSLFFIAELRDDGFRGSVLVVSVMEDSDGPLRAGADAFFCKPVDPVSFSTKVLELSSSRVAPVVMLVDDDEVNRYLLREALNPYQFRILEARSGREALEVAAREVPSLIFLDLSMPGFTGLETLRELKEKSGVLSDVPVVIHTSKDLSSAELDLIAGYGCLQFSKQDLGLVHAADKLHEVLKGTGLV
jgi:CheY-like chemotaxis protein